VAIADVAGFGLVVASDTSRELRVRLLRGLLWVAVATSAIGLWTMRRALAREARATAREKAFLAGVTHELRSPLASIRLLAETLAQGRGEPREYGSLVASESERLEGLVERVLSLARVDAAPRFGRVEPEAIIRDTLRLFAPRAARRAVTLHSRVESLPAAHWDAEAVRSALANLVENAIVHGREGGRVVVWAQAGAEELRLGVSDDGPGIGRHERRSVFGRFVRGRSPAPGSGLGLYLVEQVARAHGGRVDLETEEGKGSTFTLALPLRPPAAPGSEA
jgi:signal transduction histidine kinase